MLSLSKVITLATLAFGTFTQAFPLAKRNAIGIEAHVRDASLPTLDVALNNLVSQLHTTLAPVVSPSLEGAPHAKEVLLEVSVVLKDAVAVINSLAVEPVDQVLVGTNSVTLTLTDVVSLVNTVVLVVFDALEVVVTTVNDITQLQEVISIILQTVVELLEAVVSIVKVVYGNQVLLEVNKTLTQSVVTKVLTVVRVDPITIN